MHHCFYFITQLWDCVRSNNGIMVLLELLHIKTPITDADSIRALATKALLGLARSDAAKQIMSKLPIFASGQLQQLVREPILNDKRTEHVKFQQYAHQLMKLVSAGGGEIRINCILQHSTMVLVLGGPSNMTGNDFSLEVLHRASVVAQTKITFPKKQLLQLIKEYLSSLGLTESAAVLQREANLALMNSTARDFVHKAMTTPRVTNSSLQSTSVSVTPTTPVRSLVSLAAI